jgi:hypothetical protein
MRRVVNIVVVIALVTFFCYACDRAWELDKDFSLSKSWEGHTHE